MSYDLYPKEVQNLAMALAQVMLNPTQFGTGQKTVTGVPNAVYAHGPGGIFSSAGIDNVVISAHMTPRDLDGLLPAYATVYTNPLYDTPVFQTFPESSISFYPLEVMRSNFSM